MIYAEIIKGGNFLGLRKCKQAPCRWLVDPNVMQQIAQKQPIITVNRANPCS